MPRLRRRVGAAQRQLAARLRRDQHRAHRERVPVVLLEAVVGEVRGREVELQVGRPVAAVGAREEERLGDRRGERAAAPHSHSSAAPGFSASSSESPIVDSQMQTQKGWSWRFAPTPGSSTAARCPRLAQLVGIADPREHQQLRGADRSGGEDDLAAGAGGRERRLAGEPDARRPAVASSSSPSAVAPVATVRFGRPQAGLQEGVGGAPAAAVPLRHLAQAHAARVAVVVVGVERDSPARAPRRPSGRSACAGCAGRDVERAAVAVRRRGAPASWCSERMK